VPGGPESLAALAPLPGTGSPVYNAPRAPAPHAHQLPASAPGRVDHPTAAGGIPPAVPLLSPSVPDGLIANATPLRTVAQVRDGVAMFGGGAVHFVELPLMGAGALPAVALISSALARSHASVDGQIMLLVNTITPG